LFVLESVDPNLEINFVKDARRPARFPRAGIVNALAPEFNRKGNSLNDTIRATEGSGGNT